MVETQKKEAASFSNLFGKKEEEAPKNITDLSLQLNNVSIRMRVLEERYSNLRKSMQVTETNMLSGTDRFDKEIELINMEINEIRKEFDDFKSKMRIIVNELKGCAKTEEVEVLKKYVNMWDPINYVSQNEIDKIVEHKVRELFEEHHIEGSDLMIKKVIRE